MLPARSPMLPSSKAARRAIDQLTKTRTSPSHRRHHTTFPGSRAAIPPISAQRIPFLPTNHSTTSRCICNSHNRHYSTTPSDDNPDAPSENQPSSSDPEWAYLYGESTPEAEESIKPKKLRPASFFMENPVKYVKGENIIRSESRRLPSFQGDANKAMDSSYYQNLYEKDGEGDGIEEDFAMRSAGGGSVSGGAPAGGGGQGYQSLTMREKTIFDQIFTKLLSKQQQQQSDKRSSAVQSPYGQQSSHPKPSPMISALFESAVGPQRSGDDSVSFGPSRLAIERDIEAADMGNDMGGSVRAILQGRGAGDIPASLRYAAARKMGLSRKDVGLLESAENEAARIAEYRELKAVLDNCKNDLEIWEFLDERVFPMVEESAKTGDDGLRKGLSSNYPKLLHDVLYTLRTGYKDYSACLAVFNKVKELGSESYVIGSSVDVYNEMLLVRWLGYRDVGRVLELIGEMRLNAVLGNTTTATIISDILNDIRKFEGDSFLPGGIMMWRNEDVEDSKGRLQVALTEFAEESRHEAYG